MQLVDMAEVENAVRDVVHKNGGAVQNYNIRLQLKAKA